MVGRIGPPLRALLLLAAANRAPAPDTNGVYAVRIRYDARGNPIE
jgi:hypothetical protein